MADLTEVSDVTEVTDPAARPALSTASRNTYRDILKSTVLIGGSSIVNILVGMVRTKAMAILLGPGGVGLIGAYSSIIELTRSIAGLGVNTSGVRQVGEAIGSGQTERVARTALVLRRVSIGLGLFGGVLLVGLARPVSVLTFGGHEQAGAVAALSVAVFLRLVSDGQGALIAGTRRMGDLALMWIAGGVLGTIVSIILVYAYGAKGVVPSLIAVSATSLLASWWFSRRLPHQPLTMTLSEVRTEATALLSLGVAFMASGMLTMLASYAVRAIVIRVEGLDGAGYYQAAWTLGGLYVGLVLQSMGADLYPRLSGVANDHPEVNRLVNEQALVSLLLAGPGVVATLTMAPLVISLFYTRQFVAAAEILKWITLGMALRVVAWPMGFIVMAKGAQRIVLGTEIVATVVHVGLAWLLVPRIGLLGSGIAFFLFNLWHAFFVYVIVRQMTGFRWAARNVQVVTVFFVAIVATAICLELLPVTLGTIVGLVAAALCGLYSVRLLCELGPIERAPLLMRRTLVWCRLAPKTVI